MPSKFLNLSTDNTLGGSSPSDEVASSQKAIKKYIDDNTAPAGNYVTLDTLQTLTSGKKIFANDSVMAGDQTALLATISNNSTYTTDNAWVGRYVCGAKNLTFLMGTYRTMAGIGAHSWTNAQSGSGASWADFYLNPDGDKAVYIGGNLWTKNSGWLKIKNSGNTSGTVQVNRNSISSPTWKNVACWDDNISKFNNDAGYITSITYSGVINALGYTPYDSANPNGYQANVIETVKVNGTALTPSRKAVDITVPTVNNPTITITQGGVTKGSFTLNQSEGDTIELDAGGGGGSVDIDNVSITKNGNDEIQTVGVINQNNTSTALKQWSGTKAQYDALATKDANTVYNITDDTNTTQALLEAIYPVGAIYIGTMSVCPLSALFGTWQLVAQDRVLQGAGTRGVVGTTINESLPNITGNTTNVPIQSASAVDTWNGAIRTYGTTLGANSGGSGTLYGHIYLDASKSSSAYQNNAPVQQDAYLVNIWQRTA